ncbi:ABC transporter substrate-binding protein [Lachnoclostridium sp. An118]|uniref:ABC transporter substrate-binding protein n=1 Tax=Lachnoclostridium sp. An118 TaxID=1965547 RepID=UPI001FA90251|nr:ABC transporter substrate-binding protein [Lachnoclostridium sp. An118]
MKRRIVSILLTGAMVSALLAGCGSSSEDSSDTASDASSQEDTASEESTGLDCEGALEGVTLTLGTSGTYAPFSYYADDGMTLQGYDIAMLEELQTILGFEIADDEIQAMDYGALTTSITQGQIDIAAAALCATDERKENMNFTDTYYDAGIVVVVGEDNTEIASVEDLESGDYTVAVQTGTISYEYAAANLPESCLQTFDSQALAYSAVEDGQADATIYDAPGTAYSISTGEINLKIVGDEFYTGQAPYAIALSFAICEEYPDIVDWFNEAIQYLSENGTLDELSTQWCEA